MQLTDDERLFVRQLYRLDRGRRGAFHSTHLLPGVVAGVAHEKVIDASSLLQHGLIEARPSVVGTYGRPLVRITDRGRALARSLEGEDGPFTAA